MSGWMVCLIILAVLILLAMVRVGGAAEFFAGGLIVWVRAEGAKSEAGERRGRTPA